MSNEWEFFESSSDLLAITHPRNLVTNYFRLTSFKPQHTGKYLQINYSARNSLNSDDGTGGYRAFNKLYRLGEDIDKYIFRISVYFHKDESTLKQLYLGPIRMEEKQIYSSYVSVPDPELYTNINLIVERKLNNTPPSIDLTSPKEHELFENDQVVIKGNVSDPNIDDIVTVKYKVNNSSARNIKAFVSQGTVEEYSKALTYKNGSIYDGSTLVLGNLIDGNHTITVWAEDDKGSKSKEVKITIKTKRNRSPILEVLEYPEELNNLNTLDKLDFKVKSSDPDGDSITVSYTINDSGSVIVESDTDEYEFSIPVNKLINGINDVVVTSKDIYDFKTSKTIRLDVDLVGSKPESKTYRYELLPDKELTSHGLISWVKHRPNTSVGLRYSTDKLRDYEDMDSKEVTSPTGMKETEFSAVFDDPADKVYLELKDAQNATLIMGGVDTDEPSEN